MQVRRSPTARWTRAAATEESTPPDSAQMTLPSEPVAAACLSTRSRMRSTVELDEVGGGPVGFGPGDAVDEVGEDVLAARRMHDLGVELDPVEPAVRIGQAGVGGRVGLGGGLEAAREARDRIAVAHPDRLLRAEVPEQRIALGGDGDRRRAVLAVVARAGRRHPARGPSAGRRSRCPARGCGPTRWPGRGAGRLRHRRTWGHR